MDHYEVRKWDAWHRHVTLCLLAHAFLAVTATPPSARSTAPKGGSRSGPDPADRAGGAKAGPRDGRTGGTKTLAAGMVDVQTGAPGGRGPLPSREACPRPKRAVGRSRRAAGHRAYPRRGEAHGRTVGGGASVVAAAEGRGRQTPQRPPRRPRRHPVGGEDRIVVAGDARGVRRLHHRLQEVEAMERAGLVAADPGGSRTQGSTRPSN